MPAGAGIVFHRQLRLSSATVSENAGETAKRPRAAIAGEHGPAGDHGNTPMRKLLLIVGLLALAVGLLWIGQGTGAITWPQSSFMIRQLQWAGYGAALSALGLILIWQSKR
jgi:hypothetical protein